MRKKTNKNSTPVSKGDNIALEIEDMNHQGEGLGRYEGFTVFVPGALPGENVSCEVISVKKNYARAFIKDINMSSKERVKPPCPYYDKCGGCQLQHLSYQGQLRFKEKQVKDSLEKIGKIDLGEVEFLPILGMKTPWNYRNKIQLPVREFENNVEIGFFKQNSHELVPVEHCMIQDEKGNKALTKVKELIKKYELSPYDERDKKGLLRHVVIRIGINTDEVLLIFVTSKNQFPHRKRIVAELIEAIPGIIGIVHNINDRDTNVILGEKNKTIWGRPYLFDKLEGLKFKISPGAFYQINAYQSGKLYNKSVELSGVEYGEDKRVLDAYSGIGTIALFFSLYTSDTSDVLGLEVVPEAVEAAVENARINNLDKKVSFWEGKVEDLIYEYIDDFTNKPKPDIFVLDPPRKGCDRRFLDAILELKPEKVIYISCNPSTLARDLNILSTGDYKLKTVQPVDMFPQTVHIEAVVLIEKE